MSLTVLENSTAADKAWEQAKTGQSVIVSDDMLNALTARFYKSNDHEATVFFTHSLTKKNPQRVGILDAYIFEITPSGMNLLNS
jgi:hypothetical protein